MTKAEQRTTIARLEKDNERLEKDNERLENEKRMRTETCERAQRLINEHDEAVEAYERRSTVIIHAMGRRAKEVIEGLQLKIYKLEHGDPGDTMETLAGNLLFATDGDILALEEEHTKWIHEEDRRERQLDGDWPDE
jgi:hypothetical protein